MTKHNKFPKGSEWRRWDLHIHTKDTAKNDQFKSSTFEEFCVTLFKKALENKIAVIGITDYFSIANYKRVLNFIDNIDKQTSLTRRKDADKKYLHPSKCRTSNDALHQQWESHKYTLFI